MRRIRKSNRDLSPSVELSEKNGVRSLHLGNEQVQSAMRLSDPNRLELAYTQAMMGFLLFRGIPERMLMIGLGGGSLAKFIHHAMPEVNTVVVEIHPQVVAVARGYFHLPQDDQRLRVEIGDGAHYVARHPASADVVLVDAYDQGCPTPALCSEQFYADARAALRRNGVMVVNFLGDDRKLDTYLKRIEAAFGEHVALLQPEPKGNIIVFALERSARNPTWEELARRSQQLETTYDLPFRSYVGELRRLNSHTDRYLRI